MKLRTNLRRFYILALLILGTPTVYSLIIGSAVVILGQLIHLISAGYLVKRDELITAGPYQYVRHPLYVGSFTSDIGVSIMALNPLYPLGLFSPLLPAGYPQAGKNGRTIPALEIWPYVQGLQRKSSPLPSFLEYTLTRV
jgi:hypothetical protein